MNFDASLLVIMGLFWVTYLIIRRNFVNPMMALVEGRRQEVESSRELYERVARETQEAIDQERARFADARLRARARREELRRQAQGRRREQLEQAKAQAQAELSAAGAELDRQVAAQRSLIEERTRELADQMTSLLLGRAP